MTCHGRGLRQAWRKRSRRLSISGTRIVSSTTDILSADRTLCLDRMSLDTRATLGPGVLHDSTRWAHYPDACIVGALWISDAVLVWREGLRSSRKNMQPVTSNGPAGTARHPCVSALDFYLRQHVPSGIPAETVLPSIVWWIRSAPGPKPSGLCSRAVGMLFALCHHVVA